MLLISLRRLLDLQLAGQAPPLHTAFVRAVVSASEFPLTAFTNVAVTFRVHHPLLEKNGGAAGNCTRVPNVFTKVVYAHSHRPSGARSTEGGQVTYLPRSNGTLILTVHPHLDAQPARNIYVPVPIGVG